MKKHTTQAKAPTVQEEAPEGHKMAHPVLPKTDAEYLKRRDGLTQKLPDTLTLLVTGTGKRDNKTSNTSLLLRTCDHAIYLPEKAPHNLAHTLIDRYNEQQQLKALLQQFIHSVEHEGVIIGRVVCAVNNAKEALSKMK